MEIKTWLKSSFSKEKVPNWNCPLCNKGILKIDPKQFHFKETELSSSWHTDDDWEPEFIKYRFHGALKCKNCGDFISFLGRGEVDYFHYYDTYQENDVEGYKDVFYPLYFEPALNFFEIQENCPDEIKNEIKSSFALFWNDLPSCANKIRMSLEMLMNDQKVKKSYVYGGKRKNITLHKRIVEFKNKKPDIADFLLAIKWIGNTGSHIGKLEKIDVLEAYELLEHSINKLFDNTEDKLKKITKEINKRKGTRKRKN